MMKYMEHTDEGECLALMYVGKRHIYKQSSEY